MPTQARVVWDAASRHTTSARATRWPRCGSTSRPGSCEALGLLRRTSDVECQPRRSPTTTLLATVHDPDYIAAVQGAPRPTPPWPTTTAGSGTEDDPAFAGMHEASARIAAGHPSTSAAAVWSGEVEPRR